jgi:hypothetical protein
LNESYHTQLIHAIAASSGQDKTSSEFSSESFVA